MDIIVEKGANTTEKNARRISIDGTSEKATVSGTGVAVLSAKQLDFLQKTPAESVKQVADRIRTFLRENGFVDVETNYSPGHAVFAFTIDG
ncbi:MAG: hypothetical protein UT41_C0002G0115 [Candidatus Wolfebacteria bacterium GW2011_GWC2_39_22]|uniref:Uncharacterized protein n=2 Tax=Candidatus Wolfeibacteriota TaxID=1752735 RepID=A0A0G1K5Y7_9BACT|nr:MAG: hypothetical protein UT41_C0002G0115 [Candidatus Wolfebacteria bacterium GW2011_GWC2_39_22]KKT43249.1 MAG: hypothetical protein UW32_C0002G0110 [Candidatus Wolfebacteria bacterium GW2011_GWE2_44_13]HBI25968.1 hypothetical protein [Candidatus Wolfebacteria bacterium]